jgi:tRNA (mo5U34)-methyltransferase
MTPSSYRRHPDWPEIEARIRQRLDAHGDYLRWRTAVDSLPDVDITESSLGDCVSVRGTIHQVEHSALMGALTGLHPWRKGPFELFDVRIESEWRSDWKWQRVAPGLGCVTGQTVLDVGCGNGYFGWRALEAGAKEVVGVDPSVLFLMQHEALCHYFDRLGPRRNHLLAIPFEELPLAPFDLVMSMGVVYHRKHPQAHVARLRDFTRPGGRVLLESLVVHGNQCLYPARESRTGGRYARMRNVHVVPTVEQMVGWLTDAGFHDVEIVDVSATTSEEQRTTEWMRFESLAEALDPADPTQTVEGFPAPIRAALIAHRPG